MPDATPAPIGSPFPTGSAVTGTQQVAGGAQYSVYGQAAGYNVPAPVDGTGGYSVAPVTPTTMLGPAIQVIWSKEILFQAMPVLRFEQFAVKKTELGVMPGLTVNFMRYNNLPIPADPLVESVRMRTYASFDDVMASASRLLGRNMALYLDTQARTSLQRSTSAVYGYDTTAMPINVQYGIYNAGTPGTSGTVITSSKFYLTMATIKDAVEMLASKNIPRLGETYVTMVHPHQSRRLRDTPEFIEVTKYAAPGNFMLGEIGRLNDVVFIETTQIGAPLAAGQMPATLKLDPSVAASYWRTDVTSDTAVPATTDITQPQAGGYESVGPGAIATPGWGEFWPGGGTVAPTSGIYEGLMIGDNAFGHAISLPVELRDGGVLDFGREHALAWYGIWGFGTITDSAVVRLVTN